MKKQHLILIYCRMVIFPMSACWSVDAAAQPISIDRGVRAEGLWCFPLVTDSSTYMYLPDRSMLAVDENKKPQFSFIRYVTDKDDGVPGPDNTITKAKGGAVLHFLVTYDTDEQKVRLAEAALKETLSNSNIKIKGPIIFKEGRYALVSSIINPDGSTERKLMSVGAAPVLQGSKIALSFEIDAERSKLLLESMQMSTPDVSIVFDMTFSGLMDAYKAKVIVDWSEVNKAEKIGGGASFYFISADVERVYEELRRNNAITIVTEGEDAKMQQLVDGAYAKVMDMIFRKVEPEEVPAGEKDDVGNLLNGLFGKKDNGPFANGKLYGFGAHAVYKKKNIQSGGSSVLNFSSRTSTDRHHYITFNIGDFYKKYGQSQDYIKTVSLFDADFLKRRIAVGVDGLLLPEFDKFINNVTVTLRKKHQNGTQTVQEVNITKQALDKGSAIYLEYGSVGDADRMAWMDYEYNAQFNFRGGKSWETGWQKQSNAMINLITPYERREIQLSGESEVLNKNNVRATSVKIEYPFFDGIKKMETTVVTGDDMSKKSFDITLPAGQFGYKYSVRWQMKDGTAKTFTGESEMGILFIDNVPEK